MSLHGKANSSRPTLSSPACVRAFSLAWPCIPMHVRDASRPPRPRLHVPICSLLPCRLFLPHMATLEPAAPSCPSHAKLFQPVMAGYIEMDQLPRSTTSSPARMQGPANLACHPIVSSSASVSLLQGSPTACHGHSPDDLATMHEPAPSCRIALMKTIRCSLSLVLRQPQQGS